MLKFVHTVLARNNWSGKGRDHQILSIADDKYYSG